MGREMAPRIELKETYLDTLSVKAKIPMDNKVGKGVTKLNTPSPVAIPFPPLNFKKIEKR